MTMPYVLGAKSRAELKGVHDGLRTAEEQKALVASGASQTMNSMHRRQADGSGHAVELVPFINAKSLLQ
jgi:peptidoglycan L-alanyl-D-glutamate endopeptidase CwlK